MELCLIDLGCSWDPAGRCHVFHFTLTASKFNWVESESVFFKLTVGTLHISTSTLPAGRIGVPYGVSLQVSDGTPPFTWTSDTPLPKGLKLSAGGLLSGTIGFGASEGIHSFKVTVTDATDPGPPDCTAIFFRCGYLVTEHRLYLALRLEASSLHPAPI